MLADLMRDGIRVFGRRAPLYARLAAGFAGQPDVLAILAEAPAPQRIPVTLFAAIHDLLLADPEQELAQWYPNLTATPRTDDPLPAALAFCAEHRGDLVELVRTRTPQTNEIGRCALLLVGLDRVATEVGALAQLDVGASAGLNLLADHYAYDYSGTRVGSGRPLLSCEVRAAASDPLTGSVPARLPQITSRLGLDRNPIDLDDPEQVRWLEACVWPDQTERFERLRAAVEVAERLRPLVVRGDAVAGLAGTLEKLGEGHPVITSSWVLSYLEPERQQDFVAELNLLGSQQDLSWVSLEEPSAATDLGWPDALAGSSLSVLRLVRWRDGARVEEFLAECHPHGWWLRWL